MKIIQNPFRYGGDVGAKDLIDRQEETAQVESTIRNGEKLFLIGPRRFGKTSILRASEERLTAEGAIVIRLNAESYPTIDMLVQKIVSTAAVRLKGKVETVASQMGRFFSILKPEVKYSVVEQEWSVSVGVNKLESDGSVKLLADALDGLEKLAQEVPSSRPVGLILDEFQSIIQRGGSTAEGQIRSVIQEHSRIGYVFAGSQTRLMSEMVSKHDRPFYRLGASHFLGRIPRIEFAAHLGKNFRNSGFSVKDQVAIDSILDSAEEVPYNVLMLAHICWEDLRTKSGSDRSVLTATLVKNALVRAVNSLDPIFTQTWNKLTVAQQKTLIAVIRQDGTGLRSTAVAQSLGLPVSTLQSALLALHDQNILRDDPVAGKIRMRFEDPFFAQWVRMTVMG
jgi:energy-coupling factor transporter ATP-binding protein EcfA2